MLHDISLNQPLDGWVPDTTEPWTFSSSTAFTVSGDQTAKFPPGTRIKLTQSGTVAYFVVSSSTFAAPTTTVNITGGSDFTLANSAISANYHSYEANPQGYPGWFTYASSPQGFSSLSFNAALFAVNGRVCFVQFSHGGTSNATTYTFSLPIAVGASLVNQSNLVRVTDNGTVQTSPGNAQPNVGGTSTVTVNKALNAANGWTASGTKQGFGEFFYNI